MSHHHRRYSKRELLGGFHVDSSCPYRSWPSRQVEPLGCAARSPGRREAGQNGWSRKKMAF